MNFCLLGRSVPDRGTRRVSPGRLQEPRVCTIQSHLRVVLLTKKTPPRLPHPMPSPNNAHPPQQNPASTLSTSRIPLHSAMSMHQTRRSLWLRRRSCLRRSRIRQATHLPHSRARPRHRPAQPIPQSVPGRRLRREQGRPGTHQTDTNPGNRIRCCNESRQQDWPSGHSRSRRG